MLLALSFLVLNCRTEEYLSEEANHYNQSPLISQKIPFSEAKHKAKLLPEIEQVENKFKSFVGNNVQGKLVDYGNGVSVDTDEVIYIENGANYHTYTFNIHRENAPANAPLENLVLSLLPDGSYQEFLVTYSIV
ncbi:hypothetical protein OF897_13965 [Chryseobacterium formosus]|uniref:Lipoprotein n=1 Tax=Chryseobacterium formosus TaxID=1537363 RepID=A0ABT3XSB7_9FLAO|nr:hypothetical protein [Chryseobacterium formosus]MCX8525021.1 hypothetical protein [Chryseobacterium formosus]